MGSKKERIFPRGLLFTVSCSPLLLACLLNFFHFAKVDAIGGDDGRGRMR
jgi:hypothetical protein